MFLLAASNLPWELDMALLRRLEKRILVSLPCRDAREDMLRKLLSTQPTAADLDYAGYADRLEGYSGSDIRLVCKEAAMKPLRRLMKDIEAATTFENINWSVQADPRGMATPGPVTNDDFGRALETTKSSAQAVPFDKYEKWMAEFGSV